MIFFRHIKNNLINESTDVIYLPVGRNILVGDVRGKLRRH